MQTIITASPYEIERGKPMPSKNHAFVQGNLYFHLRSMFEQFQILTIPFLMIINMKLNLEMQFILMRLKI